MENTESINEANEAQPKLDSLGRSYATGKRKNSIARVWVSSGTGKIVVNGKESNKYFTRPVLHMVINQPLVLTNKSSSIDTIITVSGGGLSGQAGAVRHGISKANESTGFLWYLHDQRPFVQFLLSTFQQI